MSTSPTPRLPTEPVPVNMPEHVMCPSCGSEYDPISHGLVVDTGLPVTIRDLETTITTLRQELDGLNQRLADAQEASRLADAARVKKIERDFVI